MTATRRREWVGKGAKRLLELVPPPFGRVPPVTGYTTWFDADDIRNFTLLGGAAVSQWNDLSGNGNHASPFSASETKAPVLARHPTLFRGRLGVRFITNVTANGNGLSSSASAADITQTAFVIGVAESVTADGTLLGCSSDGGNQFRVDNATGHLTTNKADTALLGTQSNAGVVVGTPFLAVQVLSSSNVQHILNGTSETDAHAQTFTAGRTLQIGNSISVGSGVAGFTGWICEVVIYDTTLSAGDITLVSDHLRSKWDV